jgi:heme-degrading monooxygenase HmoA
VKREGPVVSVLELHVRDGKEPEVVRAYIELEVFERSRESGGFRAGRLLEPSEPGRPLLVIAEWDDAGSYDRWLVNPVREKLGEQLAPLLDDKPVAGRVFYEAVGR